VRGIVFAQNFLMNADTLIQKLDLQPLSEEGGYYRRSYTSNAIFSANRAACSAIYYLITPSQCSFLHRLREAEELFHYYAGDPVEMITWTEGSDAAHYPAFGNRVHMGEEPQILIPSGVWQGMRLRPGGQWALLGTTVCPAWEGAHFELAGVDLLQSLPANLRTELAEWMSNA
jgi:predicted cupin superfamily sugar epimerase